MKSHMTNTDNPIDFPQEEIEPILLDPGCAERGCMGYSPQFGDTECEEYFPATLVYDLQREIARLRQEVAFLEDWRAVWAPTIKQIMGIDGKCGEE